jgi:hypothetical protein
MSEEHAEKIVEIVIQPEPETESDLEKGSINAAVSSMLSRRQPLPKPNISALLDAVQEIEGEKVFVVLEGEKVIIDYADEPWIPVQEWTVEKIDYETGNLRLWSHSMKHYGMSNYINAAKKNVSLKIPDGQIEMRTKRKRGRPRKRKNGRLRIDSRL